MKCSLCMLLFHASSPFTRWKISSKMLSKTCWAGSFLNVYWQLVQNYPLECWLHSVFWNYVWSNAIHVFELKWKREEAIVWHARLTFPDGKVADLSAHWEERPGVGRVFCKFPAGLHLSCRVVRGKLTPIWATFKSYRIWPNGIFQRQISMHPMEGVSLQACFRKWTQACDLPPYDISRGYRVRASAETFRVCALDD